MSPYSGVADALRLTTNTPPLAAVAFATTSPLNGVLLWCVKPEQRVLSMALAVVLMHILGDVPSPVIVGVRACHHLLLLSHLYISRC